MDCDIGNIEEVTVKMEPLEDDVSTCTHDGSSEPQVRHMALFNATSLLVGNDDTHIYFFFLDHMQRALISFFHIQILFQREK